MILPLYVPIFLRPLSTAMRCLTISVTHRALLAALVFALGKQNYRDTRDLRHHSITH